MVNNSEKFGTIDSFILVANNMIGPGMMGLPFLFQEAGIIPTTLCLLFIGCSAALCGTFLSETIALVPGNSKYERKLEYSSAFRMIIGGSWHNITEVLFLATCLVQSIASLVETAQSFDGFFASYLLGNTYALQLLPYPQVLSWSINDCVADEEGCIPFQDNGVLILSLGYLCMTAILLPLGTGNLKDTMLSQRLSFCALLVLLCQFYFEFVSHGNNVENSINSSGESNRDHILWGTTWTNMCGVILFNYPYVVSVPSWLHDKEENVSVNKTIWLTTALSTIIYLTFGIVAALCYDNLPGNILTLLASNESHSFTRVCAALFGVTIIGIGVPVFSVIMKRSLVAGGICQPKAALFWGAIFPYLLSWMLYQGSFLLTLLNWTGLIVNGLVAFVLPVFLSLESSRVRAHCYQHAVSANKTDSVSVIGVEAPCDCLDDGAEPEVAAMLVEEASKSIDIERSREKADKDADVQFRTATNGVPKETDFLLGNAKVVGYNSTAYEKHGNAAYSDLIMQQLQYQDYHNSVNALPAWLVPHRYIILVFLFVSFALIVSWSIVFSGGV